MVNADQVLTPDQIYGTVWAQHGGSRSNTPVVHSKRLRAPFRQGGPIADHPNVERLRRGYEAYTTGTAERSGERIHQKVVHVLHLNADGKVTEWWNFWEDQ